jgi:hypothetical protein
MYEAVTPAQAGVQEAIPRQHWIPAFAPKEMPLGCAGMTAVSDFMGPQQ